MTIETGSQNASRIPGEFAYVRRTSLSAGIEPVESIQGGRRRAPGVDTGEFSPGKTAERISQALREQGRGLHVDLLA